MPGKILLVDDYQDALDMWALYLRTLGYDVTTAGDGLSAVTMALDLRPDLVVMDLVLPGIDGCEAARRLRASAPTSRVPIIATTGSTHPRRLREAQDAGVDEIMIKPCDPPRMVEAIERALGQRTPHVQV